MTQTKKECTYNFNGARLCVHGVPENQKGQLSILSPCEDCEFYRDAKQEAKNRIVHDLTVFLDLLTLDQLGRIEEILNE